MTQKNLTAKKELIYWFLTSHNLKWPHVSKLLYFLYNWDHLLERTIFTKHLNNRSDTLLISADGSKTFPFICKLNGKFYSDVEQIIHLLRSNPPEILLCRLSVPVTPACSICAQPRQMKLNKKLKRKENHDRADSQFSNPRNSRKSSRHLKAAFDRDARILLLAKAIDDALDSGNKADFYRYSSELRNLTESKLKH